MSRAVKQSGLCQLYSVGKETLASVARRSFCTLCPRIPELSRGQVQQEPWCRRRCALLEPLRPRPAALLPHHHRPRDPRRPGLHRKAPWFQIHEDRAAAATTVYVTQSVRVVDNLKTILVPILPHTAQKLHEYLGYEGQLFGTQHVVEYQEETRSHRALSELPAGQALRQPSPLFKKLDESVVEEDYARLEE
jgi:hypothetical protein